MIQLGTKMAFNSALKMKTEYYTQGTVDFPEDQNTQHVGNERLF